MGLAWIWLCLFFLLGNRGRLGLLACSVLVAFPILQADRFPSAAVEARAVSELRVMAKQQKPTELNIRNKGIQPFC